MSRAASRRHGFTQSLKPEGDPIDPAFLQLNAQAFDYSLINLQKTTNPTAVHWTDGAKIDSQNFMDSGSLSGTVFRCVGKAENGLQLNVSEIQSRCDSFPKHMAESRNISKARKQILPDVPVYGYNYPTHNIKVGGEDKVLVTFSESVYHFYCQFHSNLHMLEKVCKSIAKLPNKLQTSGRPLGLNTVCLAKYTDDQWYRGLIVETSPNLKVNFVDYGDTIAVLDTNIQPLPPEAITARSVPVQAFPMGLFNVPADLPQEINEWFADHAVGNGFTILVAAKGKKGKLLVELFDGPLNVNALVREKVSKMRLPKMTALISKTKDQQSLLKMPNEDCSSTEDTTSSVLHSGLEEQNENEMCATRASSPQVEQVKTLDIILEKNETTTDTFIQSSHSNLEINQLSSPSSPEQNGVGYMYKWPNISESVTADVYASSIAGPHHFWCQHTNTEDLDKVSSLANEAAQAQAIISSEHLESGMACLALFPDDNHWYRAQVIGNGDNQICVLFVDYGNECDVEKKDVRLLPKNLLAMEPQAFLCCLDGFKESSGSWIENVYDEFYNLIVDKPLKVKIVAMKMCNENAIPQHAVTMECDKIGVKKVIEKYWQSFSGEHSGGVVAQTKTSVQDVQTEDEHYLKASEKNTSPFIYKLPEVSRSETEMVYASCIAEPKFFWCQFANTEDLCNVTQLAQEAGKAQQDVTFLQSLGPGSHCLALFPDDKLWYRALVLQKRVKTVHVLFVDYGNESDVDVQDIRSLPNNLLEKAPQALLCRLFGFDESKGSWDDQAYDFFYNLLINKLLKLTVLGGESYSEIPVPQYSVEIECEGVSINEPLQHFWKPFTGECAVAENL